MKVAIGVLIGVIVGFSAVFYYRTGHLPFHHASAIYGPVQIAAG